MVVRRFNNKEELNKFYETFTLLMSCSKIRKSSIYWAAKYADPCPTCENARCDNAGKSFKYKKRLVVLILDQYVEE
jgi:hypothetical protein